MIKHKRYLTYPQIAILGFAGVILVGALLLMLPISSSEKAATPFTDALFTATTSVCVTGLVVRDTGTYWSLFGQTIILLLIQIGGLGVVTVAASLAMVSGRKIGLFQRNTIQEAVAAPKISGIVRLTGFILKATLLVELIGAAALAPTFVGEFGWTKGLWMSLFHSISAFCNAGIDLMGGYSSMTGYASNPAINLVLMALIICGGLGFLTWDDIRCYGIKFKRYRTQSKIILTFTLALIILPAIIFFFFEFSQLPLAERLWTSLFQAVTPRTAGFNTVSLTSMSEAGQMLIMVLMLIGGSPGSTAGGVKTTTFAVVILCAAAIFKKREDAQAFGRRISKDAVATAATIVFMYVSCCAAGAMLISRLEGLPMLTCMYETMSAIATVGLSLGITPELGQLSKYILILLMFTGRVGGLTVIYSVITKKDAQAGRLPLDKITVG